MLVKVKYKSQPWGDYRVVKLKLLREHELNELIDEHSFGLVGDCLTFKTLSDKLFLLESSDIVKIFLCDPEES